MAGDDLDVVVEYITAHPGCRSWSVCNVRPQTTGRDLEELRKAGRIRWGDGDGGWFIGEGNADNPLGLEALLPADRALEIALRWGGCEGDHHRMWVIDQMVRQLTGPDYEPWVQAACFGSEGPDTYEWDTGTAP